MKIFVFLGGALWAENHHLLGLTSTDHPQPPNRPFHYHCGLNITTYQELPPTTTLTHLTTPFHHDCGLKITTHQDLPPPTTLDHLTIPFHYKGVASTQYNLFHGADY